MLHEILVAVILVLVYIIISHKPPKSNAPIKHPEAIVFQDFTPKQLAKFNGIDGQNIYLAVKGDVFDVSRGKSFYGPGEFKATLGSMYENFAGRDASRGLAKNSFDKSNLTAVDAPIDDLSDLSQEEKQSLDEWFSFFNTKYERIGRLINQKEE